MEGFLKISSCLLVEEIDFLPIFFGIMTKSAEQFFTDGCGRCALMSTPQCKVQRWKEELAVLRQIICSTELKEDSKWGMPCYTINNANVAMIAAFNDYCSLSFFKGVLLNDEQGLLLKAGENSQSARLLKFTSLQEIETRADQIRLLLEQAIALEKAGRKVPKPENAELPLSPEFIVKFEEMPALKQAFEALTPGRRRSHHIYVSGAKQAQTRVARVEKCIPQIMAGKGWNE